MSRPVPSAPALPRRRFFGRLLAFIAGASLPGLAPRRSEAGAVEPYIGDIMPIAWNFAPKGWALCNGQLLPINQNQALFSILGTTYGGNGQTTFALPDLRGCVPIHWGQGPGLSNYVLGQRGGELNHTLLATELPSHTHTARGNSGIGGSASPPGAYPARNAAQIPQYGPTADTALGAAAIASMGGSQPHTNTQPYTTINFIICLVGIFPSHS